MVRYKKISIDQKAIDHLRASDPKMKKLIDAVGPINRDYIPNPFVALVNSIVFQQLAYKAAVTIWNQFEELIHEMTPQTILNTSDEALRTCGLSRTKVNYIKNIALAVVDGDLELDGIQEMDDEEIIKRLVKIKGIGQWTAEMFLIFSLNRKNVISYKDLGIRKGVQWLYNLKKEPTEETFNKIIQRFEPYNTLASFYLWEITIKDYFMYEGIDSIHTNNYVGYLASPIGLIEIQSSGSGITRLAFVKQKRYDEQEDILTREAINQLEEYFMGKRKNFDLPICIDGTNFQSKVWNTLLSIAYGKTLTYGAVATNIGNKKASRAVGNANNKNKIAIIIPCHRVVGSNGKLVGYEGGLWRKKWLLEHEAKHGE